MAKKQSSTAWLVQPIAFVLIAFCLFLQYQLLFAKGGLYTEYKLDKNIQIQQKDNQELSSRNQRIITQITELKQGNLTAIEGMARSELGMVKKGEQYYQVAYS